MTILITGGNGKTGGSLAKLLHAAGHPFIIATRTGKAPEPFRAVKFDWFDSTTFENPFNTDPTIDRVYLVLPPAHLDTLPVVAPFIDLAISKGVKRIVLLTAIQSEPGSPTFGVIHTYLAGKGIEYAVLRPSWFMENFSINFYQSIRENNEITSATGDGKIPWIAVEDIAQIALDTLTASKSIDGDLYVVGPQLLTYDEAASILSSVLEREIKHKKNTPEDQVAFYAHKMTTEFAQILTWMEGQVAEGKEEAYTKEDPSRTYVGKHTLEEYFRENRNIWIK